MPQLERADAVPASHSFLENINNEIPSYEMEAKLGFEKYISSDTTIELIEEFFASNTDISNQNNTFHSGVNTVNKYTHEGENFSVVHRFDGVRFVKRKSRKIVRTDGVIISEEARTKWDNGSPFPSETGISLEKSKLVGIIYREKKGIFVLKDMRTYQIVLDTVNCAPQKKEKLVSNKTLQQLEIEYKGSNNYPLWGIQESEVVSSIANDIVYIRGLIQANLSSNGIFVHVTRQTKTKWLLENILTQNA